MSKKIQVLKDGPIVDVDVDVANSFCPTDKGGGVDPSCGGGKGGGGSSGGESGSKKSLSGSDKQVLAERLRELKDILKNPEEMPGDHSSARRERSAIHSTLFDSKQAEVLQKKK